MGSWEPFEVTYGVTNKEDVVKQRSRYWSDWAPDAVIPDWSITDKLANILISKIPEKLQLAGISVSLAIKKKSIDGLTGKLIFEMQDSDLATIKGFELTDHLVKLKEHLKNLYMAQLYEDYSMEDRTAETIRASLEVKIRAILKDTLAEEGVRFDMSAIHEPSPNIQILKRVATPNRKLFYRITIPDRKKVAEAAGTVKGMMVYGLSGPQFLSIVQEQLVNRLPTSLENKLGGSLQVKVETETDVDAGDSSKKESFGLTIEVDDVEIEKLLRVKKGQDFAHNFQALSAELAWMHENGVAGMDIIRENIRTDVLAGVNAILEVQVPEQLQVMLNADVQVMSEDVYKKLQDVAANGRCCGFNPEGSGKIFFVSKDMLGGAGLLGTGYLGRSGHCPMIDAERRCKDLGGEQSHYRALMDCFQIEGAVDLKQSATSVTDMCPEKTPFNPRGALSIP
eukprot:gnl/MRDRNA2_/MRDRNA2_198603_c0_seq1.p1 gnl/MRDRNA2_/MRDRNA2_198603_c0~~gnl/MRDRNA2_/MRDRNA2_198603_c0_seq1.p1  ORF type:complete len:452 (+),score=95.61 gnl/MRDRNA2_/MRDRNA2_198603_c0_seq1:190-1545(+)